MTVRDDPAKFTFHDTNAGTWSTDVRLTVCTILSIKSKWKLVPLDDPINAESEVTRPPVMVVEKADQSTRMLSVEHNVAQRSSFAHVKLSVNSCYVEP